MEHEPTSGRPAVGHSRRADLSYLETLFKAEVGWQLSSILAWVIEEGRHLKNPAKFIARLCDRLVEAGAPVWRLGLHVRTMHPRFAAWYLTWSRDSQRVAERMVGHSLHDTVDYDGSPMQSVGEGGGMIRCCLGHLDARVDHPSLQFLAARGGTDYVAFPLAFSTGQSNALCMATDHPDGFSELDIAKFHVLAEILSLPIEVFVEHRTALALLDTYVGPRAGRRVLQGVIRRGDGDVIDAAIWFSDLRDFTAITESVPWAQLLDMLNDYFALVDAAVRAQGGEILHFIGDAILTVFPLPASGHRREACQAALEAARDAFAAVATVNKRRCRAGHPAIRFGVGLHVGEVIYGNIGSSDRLNFTVMGAAVNRAARLQNMTKILKYPVLASAAFAGSIDERAEFLGRYAMKGIDEPQEVFAFEGLSAS